MLKADDEVVRVADEIHLTAHPQLHHRLQPSVEDIVQVHVGEDGAHGGPLGNPVGDRQ
jgi:hypothetical protein